ncbi:MAG: hypothetical protein AB7K41_16595, partial [Bdellovibrionales bacterium]
LEPTYKLPTKAQSVVPALGAPNIVCQNRIGAMKIHERFEQQFRQIKNATVRDALIGIEAIDFGAPSYGIFNPNQTVFVGRDTPLHEIFGIFSRFRVYQFVQIERPDFMNNLYLASAILKHPGRFTQSPYPMLFPNQNSSQETATPAPHAVEFTFQHYQDRNHILSKLETFLEQTPAAHQQIDSVVLIIDEMMKNSLWAPIDDDGRRIYSPDLNSITDPRMEPDKPGKIFVLHDAKRLIIGCKDLYGSLEPTGFVDLLNQTFDPYLQEDLAQRNYGLGYKNMIDHSSDLIVVSRRNVQTVVCCSLQLGIPSKKHLSMPKNIHFHFY